MQRLQIDAAGASLARRKLAAERHGCFITYRSLSTLVVVVAAGPSFVVRTDILVKLREPGPNVTRDS